MASYNAIDGLTTTEMVQKKKVESTPLLVEGDGAFQKPAQKKKYVIEFSDDACDYLKERLQSKTMVNLITLSINSPSVAELKEKANDDLGLHPLASLVLMMLPLFILVVQVGFFLTLGADRISNVDFGNLCPMEVDDVNTKMAASLVAILYFVRFWLIALSAYAESFAKWQTLIVNGSTKSWLTSGESLKGSSFDFYFSQIFNISVAFLNMLIVFESDSTIDVVLNSLAIEFVSSLDDEYVSLVLEKFPFITRHLIETDCIRYHEDRRNEFRAPVSAQFLALAPIPFMFVCIFLLPVCM
eukprot:CAMPEP_0185748304 /NCGR_PEP_ID=MMETSP1174-20130828/6985_1 /TAXON_ID=35687 /ORGANISM="Dictyocha speculum, Strain CCMP1381" /LENGTH=298 /DNA_ID=CAMNT_0028423895 /DNA_START=65 /DNA_END=961 /DNA_ORIENTATION=+